MDTTCAVRDCARPVTDATCCAQCGRHLLDSLRAVPALLVDLDLVRARLTRYGQTNGYARSAERPLPFDPRVMIAESHLRGVLVAWVRLLRAEDAPRATTGAAAYQAPSAPAEPSDRAVWPADDLTSMAGWMAARAERVRHHVAGHEAIEDVCAAIAGVQGLLDIADPGTYAGPCACGRDLYADRDASVVACHGCGATHTTAERRAWLLEQVVDRLATATEIARMLSTWHEPISAERIRKWKQRRRLLQRGRSTGGDPTYRIGDVLDLLREPA